MKALPLTTADTVQFTKLVRRLHFFGTMNMVVLERILAGLELRAYEKAEKVCVQGEPGDAFYVVQSGRLAVTVKRGRLSLSRQVAVLEQGDCFGEMALLHDAPRTATVACLEASQVFRLSARHFRAVLAENPEFAAEIRELAESRQFELDYKYS